MNQVAFTSTSAGSTTRESIRLLHELGVRPIVISPAANRRKLQAVLTQQDLDSAVILPSFKSPATAALLLAQTLSRRKISLANWINITDDSSAFFLRSCQELDLRFPFLSVYQRCRVKPLARSAAAAARLCDVRYCVHDVADPSAPHRFLFPFIAKPILGTASEGVHVVTGLTRWDKYLRHAGIYLRKDEVVLGKIFPGRQLLIEEIIAGQECQVDGLVSRGKVTFCALGVKTSYYSDSGFRETSGMLYKPYSMKDSRSHDSRVMNWCERLLDALQFDSGTFHIEAKVTGPQIRLLEVNPRPGGGANVPVIEKLSGVNLNRECIRLWLGFSPSVSRRAHTSIASSCFAVRYPARPGYVGQVRPPGVVSGVRTSNGNRLVWTPLVAQKQSLDPDKREQYLGVLTADNACHSLQEHDRVSRELVELIQRPYFLREVPLDPRKAKD